jgi:hypothetical protein
VSSPDDQKGTDDRPQGRIFVPEAWLAPDGAAVSLSAQAMKLEARWLRRAQPRPFGFAPDSPHPAPERIGKAHGAGTVSSGLATVLGFRAPVWAMSILYGDAADPSAPLAEITSLFHRELQDRDLKDELIDGASEWRRWAAEPDAVAGAARAVGTQAEVTSGTIEVVISGARRAVPMLRQGEMSAFEVRHGKVLVTVLARHMGPEFPEIVRLADLEPMLSRHEHPDREEIATAFALERRQRTEDMRN